MSNPDGFPLPSQPVPPKLPLPRRIERRKRRGPMPFMLLGCGGAFLIVLLAVGLFFIILHYGGQSVDPYVTQYFERADRGEFASIYADAHAELKSERTAEEFVEYLREAHEPLGPFQRKSLRGIRVHSGNTGSTATATYRVKFAEGEATVEFDFLGEREQWKLSGIRFEE